jgi:transcriptional regulator with XRE-family HTH domain
LNKIELAKRIWELRFEGKSLNQIAEITGVNKCVVATIVNYTKSAWYGQYETDDQLIILKNILNKLEKDRNLGDFERLKLLNAIVDLMTEKSVNLG